MKSQRDDGTKSCVVEIDNADAVEMPHLPKHHFSISQDTTELKFEHNGSHKHCMIKRKQVPIEPGFAITVHKAQGHTMDRVIVDLAGCSGTEPPYAMTSRAISKRVTCFARLRSQADNEFTDGSDGW